MNATRILLIFLLGYLPVPALPLTLSQSPLFIASTEPRVMLVASRDHQLSIKAYTDYTDIDSNGSLDITYNDSISYYGYFDFNKCYTYASSNSRFEPASTAAGLAFPLNHQCNGQWSGNLLNWATMARMDVLRKTFYGGYRSTDTVDTVLERSFLPNDVHAFVKVYNPGSAATLSLYMPASVVGTNTALSLCNVSDTTSTTVTGQMSFPLPVPLIKVAAGAWYQWDSSEVTQCELSGATGNTGTQPAALIGTAYTARIKVCVAGSLEDNCKTYTNPTTGVQTIKPVGLLQNYGDADSPRQLRFGLMTGSYNANKSGGVLRKNVGLIANNNAIASTSSAACSPTSINTAATNINANDEIDVCTGQFINQNNNPETGIINTLDTLHIAQFKYASTGLNGGYDGTPCNSYGALTFNNGECVDWGNPMSEIYLESLRYFAANGNTPTVAFNISDNSIIPTLPQTPATTSTSTTYSCNSGYTLLGTTCTKTQTATANTSHGVTTYSCNSGYTLSGTTCTKTQAATSGTTTTSTPAWADPLPADQWCALSSVIALSTGINSFDTDELASFTTSNGTAINSTTLTDTVGASEGINGQNYLIGSNSSTTDNQCTAKTLGSLNLARGICPEEPGTSGGYGIAGLAYAPKSIDLRPEYAAQRNIRWGDNPATTANDPINADWVLRQPFNTYTVQLAETLPSFSVPVGTGKVTLVPSCQANNTGNIAAWNTGSSGWRNCGMVKLNVDANVAPASVGSDHTAQTNTCGATAGTYRCFSVVYDDTQWGNDHDMDVVQRLGYCVGLACDSFKMLCPTTGSAYATIGSWTSGTTAANQIRISTCVAQASAGNALTIGYTIAGTGTSTTNNTTDGVYFPVLRPGNANFYEGATLASGITAAQTTTFNQGSSTATLLNNPLWYAAKYGSFTESTPATGTPTPNLTSEWDIVDNSTGIASTSTTSGFSPGDGIPDNYFNVRNPATLITALSTVFDRASQPDASSASVATNSTSLQISGRIFQAKFSSADWSGQLLSYKINTSGVLSNTSEWDAGQIINSQTPDSRIILTKGASDGVAFQYANLTGPTTTAGTQMNLLDKNAAVFPVSDNCGLERVAYLRGDATHESANGTFACASTSVIRKFRQRNASKLGDTINSNPLYVGLPAAGFSDVDHPGYSSFQSSRSARSPVVYVGSNDGMLHGFDASLDFSSDPSGIPITNVSGKEKLAYLPSAVFPNLSKLTNTSYNKDHYSFVDGSPMFADADLDSSTSNNWRTVLVGAMAAGGKGYYALDISDPASFSETAPAPANTLLWEFDETDMGYVYNMPPISPTTNQAKQIVKMANGKWAVIVGNGYNSTAGKAVLYILFIENGVDGTWSAGDYVKIIADAPVGLDNGLSTPVPFDSNGDGYADTVYAGDLKGNMWKFLVGPNSSESSVTSTTSTWKVAFSGSPLFIAKDSGGLTQPIIWPPEVTVHPNGGQLILFGTGKYIEPSDNTSTSVQTFYGIWDKHNGTTTLGTRAIELLQQTVASTTSLTGGNYRIPSANVINWRLTATGSAANCTPTCTPTHLGWYIDLPSSKERNTGIPKLINDVIFFNTYIPSTAVCDAGGTGWLMSLDTLSGGLVSTHRIFDTSRNGIIDASDTQVGGFQVGAVLGGTTLIQNDLTTSNIGVGVSATTSGNLSDNLINFGGSSSSSSVCTGRCSWREIMR